MGKNADLIEVGIVGWACAPGANRMIGARGDQKPLCHMASGGTCCRFAGSQVLTKQLMWTPSSVGPLGTGWSFHPGTLPRFVIIHRVFNAG